MRRTRYITQDFNRCKRGRTLGVLLLALTIITVNLRSGVASHSVLATERLPVTMLAGTTQVVDDRDGDQSDPHAACNLASYTSDNLLGASEVRYYDFATHSSFAIPGNGADSLSGVSGGLIALTEWTASGPQIVLFDTASQTRTTIPGFEHSRPAIATTVVAFEDRTFFAVPNQSEISVYDLTKHTATRLTNDNLFDKHPNVSATGNAVVWEKCQTDGTGCDIYGAVRSSTGSFTVRSFTSQNGENRSPVTNDEVVAYISDRNGETDIYFRPLNGGTETHLSIPGRQRDLSIWDNVMAFESEVQLETATEYDIFVYDLSTGSLYQATNTAVDETLNDIAICNGAGRLVYAAPGANNFDVFAFTFQVPSAIPNQIEQLIALVQSFNLAKGTAGSLTTKLQDALTAVDATDTATACDRVNAFINECLAQSGKKLTVAQSQQLIGAANEIKTAIGCS